MRILPLVLSAVFITGCASKSLDRNAAFQKIEQNKAEKVDQIISNIPDWFIEGQCEGPGICGLGTAISPDLQMALNLAEVEAYAKLAETIKSEASSIRQSYKEVGGSGGAVTGRDKQIIDIFTNKVDLAGAELSKKVISREAGDFRVYVEAFYPLGDANYIKKLTTDEALTKSTNSKAELANDELLARIKE
jgi:hypothetical protein